MEHSKCFKPLGQLILRSLVMKTSTPSLSALLLLMTSSTTVAAGSRTSTSLTSRTSMRVKPVTTTSTRRSTLLPRASRTSRTGFPARMARLTSLLTYTPTSTTTYTLTSPTSRSPTPCDSSFTTLVTWPSPSTVKAASIANTQTAIRVPTRLRFRRTTQWMNYMR